MPWSGAQNQALLHGNAKTDTSRNKGSQASLQLHNNTNKQRKINSQKPALLTKADGNQQVDNDPDASGQSNNHRDKNINTDSNSETHANLDQHRGAKVHNGNDNVHTRLDIGHDESAGRDLGGEIDAQLHNEVDNDLQVNDDVGGEVDVDINGCVDLGSCIGRLVMG